jgi:hypothetical protein
MKEAQNELIDANNRVKHVKSFFSLHEQKHEEKMKEYFKKSEIYQKFVQEYKEEQVDNKEFDKVENDLITMKANMKSLNAKYDALNEQIKE